MDKRSLFFLFITIFINLLGFGIVFPLLPFYAEEFNANALTISLLFAAFPAMQFLFAPLWGRVSDKVGRKPVLLFSVAGTTLAFTLFAFAQSLFWLFAVRIVHGVLSSAALPTIWAAVADSTDKENRAQGMGVVSAGFGLGFAVGPALGGILSNVSITFPFLVAAVIAFLNFISIFIFLPETLKEKSGRKFQRKDFFNLIRIYEGLKGEMRLLFILLFATSFSFAIFGVAYPLLSAQDFGFGPSQNGLVFAVTGVLQAGVQAFLVGPLNHKFGGHRVVSLGMILGAFGLLFLPFTLNIALSVTFLSLMSIGNALARPTLNSVISRETTEAQGVTLGIGTAFESFGRTIGPVLVGFLATDFGLTVSFIFTAAILFLGFIISLRITHPEKR